MLFPVTQRQLQSLYTAIYHTRKNIYIDTLSIFFYLHAYTHTIYTECHKDIDTLMRSKALHIIHIQTPTVKKIKRIIKIHREYKNKAEGIDRSIKIFSDCRFGSTVEKRARLKIQLYKPRVYNE